MSGAEYWFHPTDTLIDVARELAEASGYTLVEPDSASGCWRLRTKPLSDRSVWHFEGDGP